MEKWRAVAFSGAVVLSFGIFVALCLHSIGKSASVPMSSQEKLGKRIWQKHGCVQCHTIFGHGGYLARDLTGITNEVPVNRIKKYLYQPPLMRPAKRRKHPGLERREAEAVAAYLQFTARINTLGWPPQPNYIIRQRSGKTKEE